MSRRQKIIIFLIGVGVIALIVPSFYLSFLVGAYFEKCTFGSSFCGLSGVFAIPIIPLVFAVTAMRMLHIQRGVLTIFVSFWVNAALWLILILATTKVKSLPIIITELALTPLINGLVYLSINQWLNRKRVKLAASV